jgi:hypothetical protein
VNLFHDQALALQFSAKEAGKRNVILDEEDASAGCPVECGRAGAWIYLSAMSVTQVRRRTILLFGDKRYCGVDGVTHFAACCYDN